MNFDKFNEKIMLIDPTIRYAAVQNNDGENICGHIREGITPYLSDDEIKMMHYYAGQRWDTRKRIAHKIGNAKYAMAEYDKIKRFTFPIDEERLLMLTTEINSDSSKIIPKVLELIKNIQGNEV
ncbi:MAG: DUF6659 family protein [Nitrosopumilus sp.]